MRRRRKWSKKIGGARRRGVRTKQSFVGETERERVRKRKKERERERERERENKRDCSVSLLVRPSILHSSTIICPKVNAREAYLLFCFSVCL